MELDEITASVYTEQDPLKKIETIARVCTGTQDKVGTKENFVQFLVQAGHTSVLEHARVVVPSLVLDKLWDGGDQIGSWSDTLYGFVQRSPDIYQWLAGSADVRMNVRDFLAIGGTLLQVKEFEEADDYMTICFTEPIAISREHTRHRTMSFTERSTRYCKMLSGINFSTPTGFELTKEDMEFLQLCEKQYLRSLELGRTAQQARMFLPLCTETKLYMTGTFKQWEAVFNLRLAKTADPEMVCVMGKALDAAIEKGFLYFEKFKC